MRRAAAIALASVLAACGLPSVGPREPQRFYVLENTSAKALEAKPARAVTLLLAPTTASSFYDTQSIAYSRAPGMRAYYQYHSWTELPGRRIGELLASRLERSGGFRTVASATSGVRGELLLSTHLIELYHDAGSAPGVARVSLSAELTDPARRALVARKSFSASAAAASYDAPGAVKAFHEALGALLDELDAWIDGAVPR